MKQSLIGPRAELSSKVPPFPPPGSHYRLSGTFPAPSPKLSHSHPGKPKGPSIRTICRSIPTTTSSSSTTTSRPQSAKITHLSGRILDAKGKPIRNALVEIWQVDGNGVYLHTARPPCKTRRQLPRLRPLPHRQHRRILLPHREAGALSWPHAAHSFQDQADRRRSEFTTQCYIKGHPQNERDGIYRDIRDPKLANP